jgi:hypothetical protein
MASKGAKSGDERRMIRDATAEVPMIRTALNQAMSSGAAAEQIAGVASSELSSLNLSGLRGERSQQQGDLGAARYTQAKQARKFIMDEAGKQGAGAYMSAYVETATARAFDMFREPNAQREVIRGMQVGSVGRGDGHEFIEALNKTTEALLKNSGVTKENTRASGPRLNIDAHTE